MAPRRWRRVALWITSALVAAAAIAAAALWLYRDLPRRQVERAIARELGADVVLDRLVVEGPRSFILRGVTIRRMKNQPRLDYLRIGTLHVTGGIGPALGGRFDAVRAREVEARLLPPPAAPEPVPPGEPFTARVGRFEFERARVLLGTGPARDDHEAELEVSGWLTDVGGAMAGEFTIDSPSLPVDALTAFLLGAGGARRVPITGGVVEELHGRGTIDDGGRKVDLTARARQVVLVGAGGSVVLPEPSVEAEVRQSAPGQPIEIELRPELTIVERAQITLRLDAASGAVVDLNADLRGLSLAPVLAVIGGLPPEWQVEGTSDLQVTGPGAVGRGFGLRGSFVIPRDVLPLAGAIEGDVALEPQASFSGSATIDAQGLGRARFTGTSSFAPLRATGRVRLEASDLAQWQAFLPPAPGYRIQGSVEGDLALSIDPEGAWRGTGEVRVQRSGFSSEDGARVLEGLDTTWDLTLGGHLRDPRLPLTVHGTAAVGGFQLLWGSLFADGSGLASRVELEAQLLPGRTASGRAVWTFPDGPRLELSAAGATDAPTTWTLAARVPDLGTAVESFVRRPLGDSLPSFFRGIEAAGSLAAEASGSHSAAVRSVRGRLQLADLRLAGTEKTVEVAGLDLDLPFDLEWGPPGPDGQRPLRGEEREGSLRFTQLDVQGLEVPSTVTALRIRQDDIELKEGLIVHLLGGTLGLPRLTLVDLLSDSRHVDSAIEASGVGLAEATRAFELPALEGHLDASFPRIRLSMHALDVEGGGDIRVFGGTVKVRGLSGQEVLSRYPKLTVSAEFEDLDLAQVTRAFDFGGMTGLVGGYVRDCELFRGVPVAFEAEVRTIERRGIPRTVNVKAIENLTILGTGSDTGVLGRGVQRFLDHFTYDRIGIGMRLADDVFLLTGLERRGEQELFIKGRLPFPINVINAQPGVPISFQDMVERLRSVDLSTASVEP